MSSRSAVRAAVGRALERGRGDLASRALAAAWAPLAARSVARAGEVSGPRVVCVGGATLGGSGKTRVAIAAARVLVEAGARVALVGHAYRAHPRRARVVAPDDDVADVGDEALVCARALAGTGARVIVGPTRQSALDLAAAGADVLVVDGPLRLRRGTSLALLALDAAAPWGSGALPPAGDLRAPRAALLAAADHVVTVDAPPETVRWTDGARTALVDLGRSGEPVGLFTALARPVRILRALAAAGVRPARVVALDDHGHAGRDLVRTFPGRWLATEKCAVALGWENCSGLGVLEDAFVLRGPAREALERLPTCASTPHGTP